MGGGLEYGNRDSKKKEDRIWMTNTEETANWEGKGAVEEWRGRGGGCLPSSSSSSLSAPPAPQYQE